MKSSPWFVSSQTEVTLGKFAVRDDTKGGLKVKLQVSMVAKS